MGTLRTRLALCRGVPLWPLDRLYDVPVHGKNQRGEIKLHLTGTEMDCLFRALPLVLLGLLPTPDPVAGLADPTPGILPTMGSVLAEHAGSWNNTSVESVELLHMLFKNAVLRTNRNRWCEERTIVNMALERQEI